MIVSGWAKGVLGFGLWALGLRVGRYVLSEHGHAALPFYV